MLLFSLAVLVAALPVAVLGGEFPVRNTVPGGVPINVTVGKELSETAVDLVPAQAGALRYVENSGVCETTPGVYSASGHADLTSTEHMWFWFFAARKNPDTAPITVWLDGGPGTSSMHGLFQGHGPCLVNNDSSSVRLNPQSWNQYSNMLYIDQPIGVGFSYGDATTNSTAQAAKGVWNFLQVFFSHPKFGAYKTRDFALWTSSFGGHYGPVMTSYFLDQNAAIAAGKLSAIPINLKVLGVGNGFTDAITQFPGYFSYAKENPYHQLVSDQTIKEANASYYSPGGCRDLILRCASTGADSDCSNAQNTCNDKIAFSLSGEWNIYYVLTKNPSNYPPDFADWLNNQTKIGAETNWVGTNIYVSDNFSSTGDWMRSSSSHLEKVINAGIRTVLYVGDADDICNYRGVENMVDALKHKYSSQYASTPWTSWTIDGVTAGQFKNAGSFSYVRIYRAGHMASAYTVGDLPYGKHAQTMFGQAMAGKPISSARS